MRNAFNRTGWHQKQRVCPASSDDEVRQRSGLREESHFVHGSKAPIRGLHNSARFDPGQRTRTIHVFRVFHSCSLPLPMKVRKARWREAIGTQSLPSTAPLTSSALDLCPCGVDVRSRSLPWGAGMTLCPFPLDVSLYLLEAAVGVARVAAQLPCVLTILFCVSGRSPWCGDFLAVLIDVHLGATHRARDVLAFGRSLLI